jgi:hypothetical protein
MGGVIGDFGLPEVARVILDDDRAALGMDREAYLLHLLFQRSRAWRDATSSMMGRAGQAHEGPESPFNRSGSSVRLSGRSLYDGQFGS